MRELRKWAWAAVVATACAAPAAAQQGTITSAGGTTTGSLSGTGGLAGGGGAGQLGGGTGGTGGQGGGNLGGTPLQQMEAAPVLSAPTGQASSSVAASNFLSGYYANPYFQGLRDQPTNAAAGGFGVPLYGTTGGTGGITRGGAGTAGIGGRGGLTTAANQSGILIQLPVQINYTAKMMFPTPPVAPSKLQSEIRGIIDGTSMITNSKTVQIVTDPSNNVIIRGTVLDSEEARLVEGLVRLTPGVGSIRNELAVTPGR